MENLKNPNSSFWSADLLRRQQMVIVGGGIVGLSAAIEIKERKPDLHVAIFDKGDGRLGASVRNAGFACFGSMTEVLDDMDQYGIDRAMKTVAMRWQGLNLLRNRISDSTMDYLPAGGFEIFTAESTYLHCIDRISYLNELLRPIVGSADCFQEVSTPMGKGIKNQLEGVLNPAKMIDQLYKIAITLGIKYYSNTEVLNIDSANQVLDTTAGLANYQTCVVCTNAWTKKVLPELQVLPARNHVLVSEPLSNCPVDGAYHMDRGYVYFRNIGSRILLGGARHVDLEHEETYDLISENAKIVSYLETILKEVILGGRSVNIEHSWMGLLGVGMDKQPIIKQHQDGLYIAAKMGGMGVAMGSFVGQRAAELILGES